MLQKGRRERRQAARQRRLGPLRAGSLRGSAPSRRRHPAGLRRPLAGALGPRFRIHQLVLLSEVGEGRAPRHSRCQLGGGLLRGGAESTSKIPRHLFTQGGDTGAQEAWAPPPRRLGPAPPVPAPGQAPTRNHPHQPAGEVEAEDAPAWVGGLLSYWWVPQKRRIGAQGEGCGEWRSCKRRRWRDDGRSRSPQSPPPPPGPR